MAYCENCNTRGHDPRTLVVVAKDDTFILVGPCCVVKQQEPQEVETEYGLEMSSHYGLLAYAKLGGLKLEYRRSPEQLETLFGSGNRLGV